MNPMFLYTLTASSHTPGFTGLGILGVNSAAMYVIRVPQYAAYLTCYPTRPGIHYVERSTPIGQWNLHDHSTDFSSSTPHIRTVPYNIERMAYGARALPVEQALAGLR